MQKARSERLKKVRDEDPLYGLSQRGGIWFLVSSGTSSGMVPFKSAAVSEVVILNVY